MTWLSDRAIERLRAIGSEVDLSSTRDAPDPTGELAGRLLQEARVLATLDHPGIVPVYDAGRTGDGRAFYAMKLVRGDRLDRWVQAERSLRERLEVENLDERADVYALGAVLGSMAHPSGPAAATIPSPLRSIVARATFLSPAGRYASVAELAAEIDRFLEGRPVQAHPESPAARAGRFLWKHRVAVLLLLAYAAVRAAVLLLR